MDYDSTPITATFTAGTTRAIVNVPLINDDIVEAPETFDLIFTIPSSLQGKVIPGAFNMAAAIIIDDDSKKSFAIATQLSYSNSLFILLAAMMAFSQSLYRINEDDGPADFILVLSNPLSSSLIVKVLSTDGSATGKHVGIVID